MTGNNDKQQVLGGFEELVVTTKPLGVLREKFIIPPFSVIDTKQGYWQERKKKWIELGIQSELGRGDNLLNSSDTDLKAISPRERAKSALLMNSLSGRVPDYYYQKRRVEAKLGFPISNEEFENKYLDASGRVVVGTSIFDPVLCEIMYKWFCPEGGTILDPFAGGSVRGIVASVLEYKYVGVDLSLEQLDANREQARQICSDNLPTWIHGNSLKLEEILPSSPKYYDFVFSCPPYHDLEKYSDDPTDLSNMTWSTFKQNYASIISKAILKLNNNRFACFVVSEIRDDNGWYKGLVPFTIEAFYRGGARFYNEIVLVNAVGSLALRVGKQFASYRKVGRTHQNILVFYKGEAENIPRYFKEIDTGDIVDRT